LLPSAIAPKLTEIGFKLTDSPLYWLAGTPPAQRPTPAAPRLDTRGSSRSAFPLRH